MIEFALEMAERSGKLITDRFHAADPIVELKEDRSIVTRTDRDAEEMMREMINSRFPDHGIIGEEHGSERTDAEYVWTLDPIDGTISFVAGVPLFGTLIGLMHMGRPTIGLIHQPVLEEMVVGTDESTTHNGRRVRVRPCRSLDVATLLTTDPNLIDLHQDPARFDVLRRQVAMTRTWGDCYGYLMLASGRADIMIDPVMKTWDRVPLIPIVRGAGGVITDWHGGDPVTGSSIVAAGPFIHPQVIEVLR